MPAKVLWPEHESLYALMVLRATIGVAAFNSERQNDPQNPELCEWPAEYLEGQHLWFDVWPTTLEVKTLALDPSKGKDAKDGGLKGIHFDAVVSTTIGDTIAAQWVATGPFLAEPYKGSDAYITKDGYMQAMVTTFDGGALRIKK